MVSSRSSNGWGSTSFERRRERLFSPVFHCYGRQTKPPRLPRFRASKQIGFALNSSSLDIKFELLEGGLKSPFGRRKKVTRCNPPLTSAVLDGDPFFHPRSKVSPVGSRPRRTAHIVAAPSPTKLHASGRSGWGAGRTTCPESSMPQEAGRLDPCNQPPSSGRSAYESHRSPTAVSVHAVCGFNARA